MHANRFCASTKFGQIKNWCAFHFDCWKAAEPKPYPVQKKQAARRRCAGARAEAAGRVGNNATLL